MSNRRGSWTKQMRDENMPKQYRQGFVEFYKLKLKVDERVLIPRPETELLVDEVIEFSKDHGPLTILDVGTGSGCIAISLAKNLPKAKIFATDISDEALEVAKENAKKHKVEKKIFFLKSDLLQNIVRSDSILSNLVIVTNLPYIPGSRIPFLARSVKDFEPWLALDGGPDGFDLYRKLFSQIKEKNQHTGASPLSPKIIIAEIDESQDGFDHIARSEAKKYFPKAEIEIKLDLAKKPRILIISF